MNTTKRDEVIALYAEYVKLLEKEAANNQVFLTQSGRPVSAANIAKFAQLTADIKGLTEDIKNDPSFGNYQGHYHGDWSGSTQEKTEAKRVIAQAATAAKAEIKRQEAMEVSQIKDEAAKASKLMAKNVKEELAELASEAKTAAKKVTDAAIVAANEL